MAHIDDQLRSEIASLEEHIARTQDRFLATRWVAELVPSLRRVGEWLSQGELEAALSALRRARDRFHVNGELSVEIDALLTQHGDSAAREEADDAYSEVLLPPDGDPGDTAEGTAQVLFEEEDEEEAEGHPPVKEDGPVDGAMDDLFAEGDREETPRALAGAPTAADTEPAPLATPDPADADDLFSEEEEGRSPAELLADRGIAASGRPKGGDGPPATPAAALGTEPGDGVHDPGEPERSTDELFEEAPPPPARRTEQAVRGPPERTRRSPKEPAPGMPRQGLEEVAASVNIFSHTVALDDLQAALDIAVPSQDLAQLENLLRARLTDKVVASLRESRLAEGQYILVPRIARFVQEGSVIPCTLRNLAKAFFKLFGDLRDLRPYVSDRVMTGEVPEPGWSLITAEAPRESLGKSHMEQNQYLRYLATSLGIPSHLVRRRSLVEAVYDMIVGRLVLGQSLQRQTLDWTASSASKNDFLCTYSADEGIRVRELARTTRHPALGVCPNW